MDGFGDFVSAPPSLDQHGFHIEDQTILGTGAFSLSVVRAHRIGHPHEKYAVKIIDKTTTLPSPEVRALKMVQGHPNVIRLEQVVETNDYQYIIMELASSGTVMEYLDRYGPVSEELAKKWILQLVGALKYCYERRVVHMDVKPSNIFLDDNLDLKLGDFGLVFIPYDVFEQSIPEAKGSAVYAAPELYRLHTERVMAIPALMWAVGVTLHAILTGKLPYESSTYHLPLKHYQPPKNISLAARAFLSGLLELNPEDRLLPEEIAEHAWCRTPTRVMNTQIRLRRTRSNLSLSRRGQTLLSTVV
eukprot:CFRG3644T1